ncbi:MAG: serine hydroxymethyltransferase [Candidatus Gracilibacteria bacterium]|nr:serine hydroxymethyltransferase [Candidatus Gracilibacteria bacterium]
MSYIQNQDPELYEALLGEEKRQQNELELIASENYVSKAVLEANGSIFTNKYSEGYPGKRYYAGQKYVDIVENIAIDRAKKLFGAEHINVQPLSGSPANLAVFFAVLNHGDTILGMNLDHGGHLSHGHPLNYSGKKFNIVSYGVDRSTGLIDMSNVAKLAKEYKPKMIIAGFSAYSRSIDWEKFREIADDVGAILMADIAHIAGLVAGGALQNPVPYCDIVTTTTHKTLRGPRGAMIMCREKYAKDIDRAVFPGIQGGPHEHIILAKAIAFGEALKPEFSTYVRQIIDNARQMAKVFVEEGFSVISGGTDNHIVLLDIFSSTGLSGKQAEEILENIGISTNKNMIPYDTRKPLDPSGIRIGTAAITTRKFTEKECEKLAKIMVQVLRQPENSLLQSELREQVQELCQQFPIPSIF